jgi:hypothetical protein
MMIWAAVIALSALPILAGVNTAQNNIAFAGLQLLVGNIILLSLSERLWSNNMGFGIELFLAAEAIRKLTVLMTGPYMTQPTWFNASLEGLSNSSWAVVFFNSLWLLPVPILTILIVRKLAMGLNQQSDIPLMSHIAPIYLGFMAFHYLWDIPGKNDPLYGILVSSPLDTPTIIKIILYLLLMAIFILVFSLASRIICTKLYLGDKPSLKTLKKTVAYSLMFSFVAAMGDLLGNGVFSSEIILLMGFVYSSYHDLPKGLVSMLKLTLGVVCAATASWALGIILPSVSLLGPGVNLLMAVTILPATIWGIRRVF